MASFSAEINEWCNKVEIRLKMAVGLFLVDFVETLVERTPVGNPANWKSLPPPGYLPGTLVNNWFITEGQPYSGPMRGPDPTGQEPINQVSSIGLLSGGDIGAPIYITNPTPYALRIEYEGWSDQAPAGMAGVTVNEFQQRLNKAVSRAKRN